MRVAWKVLALGGLLAGRLWAAVAAIPEEIPCPRTAGPIRVDGRFDEATWRNARAIPMIIPVSGAAPRSPATAKVAWDDRCLYVAFETADEDVWSTWTQRDQQTCTEDCFEVFLKPFADRYGYVNLEINALGTVMDALPLRPVGGGDDAHRWRAWTCAGLKTGIVIRGTLNDLSDRDAGWTMEVAIPFAGLAPLLAGPPRPGDRWAVLLAHYDHSVYLPGGVEADSIAPLSVFSFGKADEWRQLRFQAEPAPPAPAAP